MAERKNTQVLCFANNKGGSGKSTTCANVGYALAQMGKRVLLLDGDMQLNLSLSFFPEETVLEMAQSQKNLYHAIREQKPLTEYIVPTAYPGLDLIPSSTLMSGIEYELFTKWQRELILKTCLEPVKDSGVYDYILLDAPPTLGGWVMNLLCASDRLILPVEASPWGLFGLANMFEFYGTVRRMNPALELMGVVLTKVSVRKNYFKQTLETLREMPDVTLFDSLIRVDSTIEWAQDSSQPVGAYKASSRSAQEFVALAKEVDRYARGEKQSGACR